MAEQIDFGELYRHIGVTPGCSLQEFQLAYRRRVAAMHPDRGHRSLARLQRLNTLYTAAMTFHKQHGRLPGTRLLPKPKHRELRTRSSTWTATNKREFTALGSHPWLLASTLLAVLAWAFLGTEPGSTPAPTDSVPASELDISGVVRSVSSSYVRLGMAPAVVVAIEGEPVRNTGATWHYGPSWIEFRCGVVDDWYSSPLRSLHVRSTRPETETGRAPEHCSRAGSWHSQ